jgi:hypothetical protein
MSSFNSRSRASQQNFYSRAIFANGLLFFLILTFALSLAPSLRAELAQPSEMNRVCTNFLTQMVAQKGSWAGDQNPQILQVNEIKVGDLTVARYYQIEPQGFVIVPVLKEMMPIKAYSDVSVLDERQNGGFLALLGEMLYSRMQLFERVYGSLEASQPDIGPAIFGQSQRQAWERFSLSPEEFAAELSLDKRLSEAGPLLTSSWHQRVPYNNLCPMGDGGRCVVGCVATAAAQVMNFWQWPPSGVGSHSYYWDGDYSCEGSTEGQTLSADFSDDYDWDSMPDSCDDGCSSADSAALAHLNYEVGVAFDMIYGACGSGSYVTLAPGVYPVYFKYSRDIATEYRYNYTQQEWFDLIQTEIDAGRPIQYRIRSHSIVCDGYRDQGEQLEYHMNYGWGGSFTTWFVLDSLYCHWVEPDSVCPAMEDLMIINIKPQTEPILEFVGKSLYDTLGNSDGHASPGETVEISSTIVNNGWNAYMVNGELISNDPNVTITTSTASYSTSLHWGEEVESQTLYELEISPACPDPYIAILELQMTCSGGFSFTDSFYLFVGDSAGLVSDMEGSLDFWTHESFTFGYLDEWHTESNRYHSDSISWKAGGELDGFYANDQDAALITPPLLLPEDPVLTFWHWIDAEIDSVPGFAWDGAIVMISSGDGQWYQIIPEGGYTHSILDNPASPFEGGTPCYSGSQDWNKAEFDLSDYSGVVQIMFRFGTDGYSVAEGWYIDDIEIKTREIICGDANDDDDVNVSDAVNIINYIFIPGSPAPDPLCVANANGDESVNVSDAVYIINYVFMGGGAPSPDCCN